MRLTTLIAFLFLASLAMGQSKVNEEITTAQTGTATIVNGKATITLNEMANQMLSDKGNISATYYVSITPLCNCGQFYISEKGKDSFTVQQNGNSEGVVSFDYVVYIKQTSPTIGAPINANLPRALTLTPNK